MKTIILIISIFAINIFAADSNSIDREAVRKIIRKNSKQFKQCYTEQLKQYPKLLGKVVLDWEISDKGDVKTASIKSSTLQNTELHDCMIAVLKKIQFPEAPKGQIAQVSYPFLFEKKK